jgi:CBS domain containing-hemolysin-like protein
MEHEYWLYALAAALVLVSGFFSGTEVALFALRRIDREQMARSGRRADALVLSLLEKPRRLIATFQVGNEVVNVTFTAVVVAILARTLPDPNPFACAALAVAIALPVVTLLGEVTPKTLALKAPMGWARASAHVILVFSWLVMPLRLVVAGIAELLLRPLGSAARGKQSRDLSEEEFKTLVDAGSAQGQVDQRERRIIHRVFEFSDKNVGQVMTPRDKVVALSYDLPMSRLAKEVAARGFSRIPIYQRSLDNVRGILNAKDLVPAMVGEKLPRTLAELLHDPLFVPRTTPIKRLFRTFKQKKVHMAMVVNEYGKVLGLVTMDDLLSQLFGAIRDEREGQQKAALRRGRGNRTPGPGVEVQAEVTPPPVDLAEMTGPRHARPITHDDDDEDEDLDTNVQPETEAASDAAPVPVADIITGPSGPVPTGGTKP